MTSINYTAPTTSCKAGQDVINPGKDKVFSVPTAAFAIWCEKDSANSADLSMNTSAGPISVHSYGFSLDIPDREKIQKTIAINSSDIGDLQGTVTQLRSDVAKALSNDVALDGRVTALRSGVNAQLGSISALQATTAKGFDAQGVVGGSGTVHAIACDAGSFVTAINTYVEDGHLKMAIYCAKVPALQVP